MFRVRQGGTGGGLCCRTERKLVGNMGAGCGRGAFPSELSFFFRFFDEILNFCAALQQQKHGFKHRFTILLLHFSNLTE